MKEMTVEQLEIISSVMELDSNEHLVLPQAVLALQMAADVDLDILFKRVVSWANLQTYIRALIKARLPYFCNSNN